MRRIVGVIAILVVVTSSGQAAAHCDGLDGPVVTAARQALELGRVTPVLVWVQPPDEAEVRSSFDRTLAVRKLGDEARELADRFFFETVVRLHPAGEGAPFTGLKPTGRDLGPAIPAADRALAKHSVDALVTLIPDVVREGTIARFRDASTSVPPDDVTAGREHVEAYVRFVHYVEGIYEAASQDVHGHFPEPAAIRDQDEQR